MPREQIIAIEKVVRFYRERHSSHFPKVMIEKLRNDTKGYRVIGYRKLGEGETITRVIDSSQMDSSFLMNNIIGEIGYFLGVDENEIERIFYRYRYN